MSRRASGSLDITFTKVRDNRYIPLLLLLLPLLAVYGQMRGRARARVPYNVFSTERRKPPLSGGRAYGANRRGGIHGSFWYLLRSGRLLTQRIPPLVSFLTPVRFGQNYWSQGSFEVINNVFPSVISP